MAASHPPFLQPGDTIALVAPANQIDPGFLERAQTRLESWGYRVRIGKHAAGSYFRFAATDEERAQDLQEALNDPSVRAVLCARGGYGLVRIIDRLDFGEFLRHPKWIIGFSDVTVLHSHLQANHGTPTLHATVPLNFPEEDDASMISLRDALKGNLAEYTWEVHAQNREGQATGVLTGGNLSLLCSLIGTSSDVDTSGKILFLEEVSEYMYHFDRMLFQLHRSGKFDRLAGLLIGGLTDLKQGPNPMHLDAEALIREITEPFSYPVAFGFPAGHQEPNQALYLGLPADLQVSATPHLRFRHGTA